MSDIDYGRYEPVPRAVAPQPVAIPAQAPPSVAVEAATAMQAAVPGAPSPAVARIVSELPRSRDTVLDWPVEFEGRLYTRITVARPTVAQVSDYMERYFAAPLGASLRFPVFFDEEGERVPDAVMDALDPDDDERLFTGVLDFLPARLQRLMESPPQPSTSASGEDTAPTSGA